MKARLIHLLQMSLQANMFVHLNTEMETADFIIE